MKAPKLESSLENILSLLVPGFLREQREGEQRDVARAERILKLKAASLRKPHGTRARYSGARCRCMLCRAANSRYESERAQARKNGEGNGLVSAARCRLHLAELSDKGIGRRSVADASDVSQQILRGIMSGERKNCRAQTEKRILAVDGGARRGKCLVSAAPTWRILRELLHRGFTKVQIAEWLGSKRSLQINKKRVTAQTAMKVQKIYLLLQAGKLTRKA